MQWNTCDHVHVVAKQRESRQSMIPLSGSTKRHFVRSVELVVTHFVPATLVDQHEVEIVNINAMAADLLLCQIDGGKLKLVACKLRLDARIGHAMMTKLRSDVILDDFAARLADCRQ